MSPEQQLKIAEEVAAAIESLGEQAPVSLRMASYMDDVAVYSIGVQATLVLDLSALADAKDLPMCLRGRLRDVYCSIRDEVDRRIQELGN